MATQAALCVVDVNKVAGTVTVYSPAGGTAVARPQHLPLALAFRFVVAGRSQSAANVGASCVFPIVLTYAEMAAVLAAALEPTVTPTADAVWADHTEIVGEQLANCG